MVSASPTGTPGPASNGSPGPVGERGPNGSCVEMCPGCMAPSPRSPAPARSCQHATRRRRQCSPPASAEATSVMILSPGLAALGHGPGPGSTSWGRPRCSRDRGWHWPPSGDRRRRSGCGRSLRIYLVLLLLGRFGVSQTIIPEATGHFLIPSAHRHNHLFGGLGVSQSDWIELPPS